MALPTRVARSLADLPFDGVQRDFDTFMNRFFNNRDVATMAPYAVDVREDADHIYVEADLPGFSKEDVDITLEKNVLTISGRVELEEPKKHNLVYAEYEIGDYQRVFTLSDEIDRDGITAVVKNGVLRLALPKAPQAKTRKIAVKAE